MRPDELIAKMHAIQNYKTAVKVASVVQRNVDGTYELAFAGSGFVTSRVETQLSTPFEAGYSVVVQFENNDKSQPRIIGRSPSRTGFSSTSGSA